MIIGDFEKIIRWEKYLESLSKDEFRREVAGDMALAARDEVEKSFTAEQDPFGKPWEPKKRPNGFKILEGPTKDLRHSFKIRSVSADQFKITNSIHYFRPHQDGARGKGRRSNWKLPRRQMVPEGNPLPPKLVERFQTIYRKHHNLRLSKI